jgi:hypothetical protein
MNERKATALQVPGNRRATGRRMADMPCSCKVFAGRQRSGRADAAGRVCRTVRHSLQMLKLKARPEQRGLLAIDGHRVDYQAWLLSGNAHSHLPAASIRREATGEEDWRRDPLDAAGIDLQHAGDEPEKGRTANAEMNSSRNSREKRFQRLVAAAPWRRLDRTLPQSVHGPNSRLPGHRAAGRMQGICRARS